MIERFHDTASAYRLHRAVTNEAEAISTAVWEYTANDLRLIRPRLRVLDAGTGDGRVLTGLTSYLFRHHQGRPCEMLLKEYDFHHIETLLQNMAPLLRLSPRLSLFVTNRAFRQLKDFPADLCAENTVCFDDVAGYRLQAMGGAAALLNQDHGVPSAFAALEKPTDRKRSDVFLAPLADLWNGERMLVAPESVTAAAALVALGDEIRAREIYDELAAVGGRGKHFTVKVVRQDGGGALPAMVDEFFWDLAIVSHAFNRDKDPSWVCRNILVPLCAGLAVGGVLVNVHAVDGGQLSELRHEVFGDEYSFCTTPSALGATLEAALDAEQFQLLPATTIVYRSRLTAELFASLELWERQFALNRLAVSVTYHLQIPDAAWADLGDPIKEKIREFLQRDGQLEYALSIIGVKRRA
jgi:hypothetical protein